MSEAPATPAFNDLVPRRLGHGPRLKAGVTVFGAALSSPSLSKRHPCARHAVSRREDPAVGTLCACGWTPAAKARTPGLQAVPGSSRMALRGKPKGWVTIVVRQRLRSSSDRHPGQGLRASEGREPGTIERRGTGCGTMSEAPATPAFNDLFPRRLRHGPRLKAGVTVFGAALSSPSLSKRHPCARHAVSRREDPAVGTLCACGWIRLPRRARRDCEQSPARPGWHSGASLRPG